MSSTSCLAICLCQGSGQLQRCLVFGSRRVQIVQGVSFRILHFQWLISLRVLNPEQCPLVHVSGMTSSFCTCSIPCVNGCYTGLNWICSPVLRMAVPQWATTRRRWNSSSLANSWRHSPLSLPWDHFPISLGEKLTDNRYTTCAGNWRIMGQLTIEFPKEIKKAIRGVFK